jgi:hypothetical protein
VKEEAMSKHTPPRPGGPSPDETPALTPYDRMLASLLGRPDVVSTKATLRETVPPLGIGGVSTFTVRTFRVQEDDRGSRDVIFLQCFDAQGATRLVLPSEIADDIARQREALSAKTRSKASRKQAADRKARGEAPAFLKGRSA